MANGYIRKQIGFITASAAFGVLSSSPVIFPATQPERHPAPLTTIIEQALQDDSNTVLSTDPLYTVADFNGDLQAYQDSRQARTDHRYNFTFTFASSAVAFAGAFTLGAFGESRRRLYKKQYNSNNEKNT